MKVHGRAVGDDAGDTRRLMREHAYADASKLDARRALWTFTVDVDPPDNPRGRLHTAVALTGSENVVDVGCGNGHDLAPLVAADHRGQLIAIDLSMGMLADIGDDGVSRIQADAMSIPLANDTADVVCAFHMLYHVFDIAAALRDIRRVLRPGGTFVCSTNSITPNELTQMWSAAFSAVLGEPIELVRSAEARFNIESAHELLSEQFPFIEFRGRRARVEVPDADVIIAYVNSTRAGYENIVPSADAWDDAMAWLRQRVDDEIAQRGYFEINNTGGLFVCR